MKFIPTNIPDVLIIEPNVYSDERGYFFESFRSELFIKNIGKINFVQENESYSRYGTLRGLHYQLPPFAQSKLVRVVKGKVLDVAIDLRSYSDTFSCHSEVELSEENKRQLFIPKGFAHGFVVLSEEAIFQYKVDNYYSKEHERGICYNDAALGISWPIDKNDMTVSFKDLSNPLMKDAELFSELSCTNTFER